MAAGNPIFDRLERLAGGQQQSQPQGQPQQDGPQVPESRVKRMLKDYLFAFGSGMQAGNPAQQAVGTAIVAPQLREREERFRADEQRQQSFSNLLNLLQAQSQGELRSSQVEENQRENELINLPGFDQPVRRRDLPSVMSRLQQIQLQTERLEENRKLQRERLDEQAAGREDTQAFQRGENEKYRRLASSIGGQGEGKLLTVDEAMKLNVPYGTTRARAFGRSPEKPATEGQRSAAGLLSKALAATRELEVAPKGGKSLEERISAMGALEQTRLRYATGMLNYFQTPEGQRYRTAADAWIQGVLRQESKAAITGSEWEDEFRIYFSQPGDKEGTPQLKQRLRRDAEKFMFTTAGPAALREAGISDGDAGVEEYIRDPATGKLKLKVK